MGYGLSQAEDGIGTKPHPSLKGLQVAVLYADVGFLLTPKWTSLCQ